MSEHDVVVGGGPTGMMLAAELTLADADAVIVERRAGVALESARSRGLHARTIEVLLEVHRRLRSPRRAASIGGSIRCGGGCGTRRRGRVARRGPPCAALGGAADDVGSRASPKSASERTRKRQQVG